MVVCGAIIGVRWYLAVTSRSIIMPFEIRRAVESDLERLTEIYNHYVVTTPVTFDITPFTPTARLDWFRQYNRNPVYLLLVACVDEKLIGYASSSQLRRKPAYDRSVETTIYIDPEFSGRGFGKKLYARLLLELQKAGVHRCYGIITLPNDASLALHSTLGFTKAGLLTEVGYKFDKYWDTLWTEKTFESLDSSKESGVMEPLSQDQESSNAN